jgi:hypothetical protein
MVEARRQQISPDADEAEEGNNMSNPILVTGAAGRVGG